VIPLLDVQDVTVTFGGLMALSRVSFRLSAGEILALIGPNGAGKTTLFNVVSGYVVPTSGSVRIDGEAITGQPPHVVAARGVRRTFQNGGVFPGMTVLENVLTGLHATTASSLAGLLVGRRSARRAEAEAVTQAEKLLEVMGLDALARRPAADLSFGQQRLVEIARAMIGRARLLLLDEPAVGLSIGDREHLMAVLRDLVREGVAVLLVEHVIDLVMAVSDRIVVLNSGEKIADGTPVEIRRDEAVLEAYLGGR
jgi:branched-chain amino acid transport system ATP-binding protein